jgi:hypothetical protein
MKMVLNALLVTGIFFASCSKQENSELSISGLEERREITSGGGGGGGGSVCSPISSFNVKGDYRAGETGTSTIDVNYSIKPCINGQLLSVKSEVLDWDTKEVLYTESNTPLSWKYTFRQSGLYGLYTVKLYVYDVTTGTLVATQSISVSLVSKGV